jgi:hypothetical protein
MSSTSTSPIAASASSIRTVAISSPAPKPITVSWPLSSASAS